MELVLQGIRAGPTRAICINTEDVIVDRQAVIPQRFDCLREPADVGRIVTDLCLRKYGPKLHCISPRNRGSIRRRLGPSSSSKAPDTQRRVARAELYQGSRLTPDEYTLSEHAFTVLEIFNAERGRIFRRVLPPSAQCDSKSLRSHDLREPRGG